jgi:photosystem II stability/assembly factor-like uncharacterized protein
MFIDEQHGWLAVDGMVKATTDGGQHWVDQRAYNTRDYPVQFSFVSAQQGWFSLGSPLFTTTDGGMTWREIQSNQPVWAAQFFDAQHGWGFLTNEPLMPDPALGYTSDGGQTWQPRTSPPCRWSKGRGMFSFSGPAIGWAACSPDSGSNVTSSDLYQTENGGETWSKVSPLSAGLMDEGVVWADGLFFLDDRHGWIKIGTFAGNTDSRRGLLRATRDGGHTWQSFALLNQGLENMKFASPNRGYALTDVVLLNTQDGGATWAPIYSTMSP